MNLSIIVAADENNGIGKNNQLPWHLPADLKHFKNLTTGHPIIMGRKTFDSIGKPLPNRRNIVITRQSDLKIEGAELVNSLEEALQLCPAGEQVFIIGGSQIFNQSLALATKLYFTRIHEVFDADTFFPEIDPNIWKEEDKTEHQKDEKNAYAYSFISYIKR
ncbi:dihydrofolate reductase [Daejeonella oryzae]|uniref:dihydrofolate reductase n=1 Tax=Daejeonella oryzae TaxID=1122943 RepID=UPI00041DF5CC|nr:dihydrofolate reductase [Daejeonella oryzae]